MKPVPSSQWLDVLCFSETCLRLSVTDIFADFLIDAAISNPRKAIKNADRPLGNLPLEILAYLSAYLEEIVATGQMKSTVLQGQYSKYGILLSCSHVNVDSECPCWIDRHGW